MTIVGYRGGTDAANALLAGDVEGNIGDDYARANLRSMTRALFIGGQRKSRRWPEAPTLTSVLAPYGIVPPSADFMSRYGVYAVPSSFKAGNPAAYAKLQQTLLQSLGSPEYRDYIARNKLEDLSIGKPGEELTAAFAADMVEIGKIK